MPRPSISRYLPHHAALGSKHGSLHVEINGDLDIPLRINHVKLQLGVVLEVTVLDGDALQWGQPHASQLNQFTFFKYQGTCTQIVVDTCIVWCHPLPLHCVST